MCIIDLWRGLCAHGETPAGQITPHPSHNFLYPLISRSEISIRYNKICTSRAKTGNRRKDMCAKLLGGGGVASKWDRDHYNVTLADFALQLNNFDNFLQITTFGGFGSLCLPQQTAPGWWVVGGLLGRVFWVLSSWQETPRHTVPRTPGKGFNFHRPLEHLRVLPRELKKVAGGGWSGLLSWKCCLRGSNLNLNWKTGVLGKISFQFMWTQQLSEGQADAALEVSVLTFGAEYLMQFL